MDTENSDYDIQMTEAYFTLKARYRVAKSRVQKGTVIRVTAFPLLLTLKTVPLCTEKIGTSSKRPLAAFLRLRLFATLTSAF